jgi:alkylglycerol monooxygenase
LARLLVTAAIPLLTAGWFGVPHLDARVVAILVAIPAVSALVLGWLAMSAAGREGSKKAIPG